MKKEGGAYWCNACGYHSKSKTDVTRHIESKHLDSDPIVCKFCQKSVKNKERLYRHIRKFHWNDKMDMKEMLEWHGLT